MRKPSILFALPILVLLSLGGVSPAYADVTPPIVPSGASVATGKYQTRVRMVSENVLMTIDDTTPKKDVYLQHYVIGRVDATFIMQNQGSASESFDVWFPLGGDTGFGIETVDNFRAWVDGVPATKIGKQETPDRDGTPVPWATWPATFPPGKTVTLRVTYDTYGIGPLPYAQLRYTLATGAGWYGTIGEGTVTYRLPYAVNGQNTVLKSSISAFTEFSPPRGPYTISGTDVVWHFTDLEPTLADDIALTVLQPSVWRKFVAAQRDAAANPGSASAQAALGAAATAAIFNRGGWLMLNIGESEKFFKIAADAYEAALKIEPDNADVIAAYAIILIQNRTVDDPAFNERRNQMVERASHIVSDNPDVQFLQMWTNQLYYNATQWASTPPSTTDANYWATSDSLRTATAAVKGTAVEGIRLGIITPTATRTRVPETPTIETPTATLSEEYPEFDITLRPPESPAPTPTAGAAAGSGGPQDWTFLALTALSAVIVAAVWLRRRSRQQGQPGGGKNDPSWTGRYSGIPHCAMCVR